MKKTVAVLALSIALTPVATHPKKFHAPTYIENQLEKKSEIYENELLEKRSSISVNDLHESIQNKIVLIHSKAQEKIEKLISDKDVASEISIQAFLLAVDEALSESKQIIYEDSFISNIVVKAIALCKLKQEEQQLVSDLGGMTKSLADVLLDEEIKLELGSQRIVAEQQLIAIQNQISKITKNGNQKSERILKKLKAPFAYAYEHKKATGCILTAALLATVITVLYKNLPKTEITQKDKSDDIQSDDIQSDDTNPTISKESESTSKNNKEIVKEILNNMISNVADRFFFIKENKNIPDNQNQNIGNTIEINSEWAMQPSSDGEIRFINKKNIGFGIVGTDGKLYSVGADGKTPNNTDNCTVFSTEKPA